MSRNSGQFVDAAMPPAPRPAYTQRAAQYDERTERFQGYRDRLVDALDAEPGDAVVDVGCGTGLCFDRLQAAVGTQGHVVGVDEAADMTRLARRRSAERGWDNVTVLESAADRFELPVAADGALFCAVHDILQSVEALHNVVAQLPPGAPVVAGGGKFAAPWMVGLNLQAMALHAPFVRSFDGFARPWAKLESFVTDLHVTEFALGTGYVAVGYVRPDLAAPQPSAR